jgi:hypothetical protein
MSDRYSIEALDAADFRGYVGSSFQLNAAAAQEGDAVVSVDLELAEASGPAGNAPTEFRAPFSLLFRGPLTPIMPQAIYR